MTNSPNPDNQPQSSANRRVWLLWLSRGGMAFGVVLLVGIAAGTWWARMFVSQDLAPLVEKNLSETLKRPVKLGKVESFSASGLRFGPTEIPATATDPDRASVQAIEVGFNPLQVLLTRTLELNLTLVNPDVYIEQDESDRWISTQIGTKEGSGPIKTEIRSVKVIDAKAVFVPNPKPANPRVAVGIDRLNGNAELFDKNQRIQLNLSGQLATGGNFSAAGEYLTPTQQANLQLQGQNLLVADLDRLVKFPFDLGAGRADGNITVKYTPGQPLSLVGVATLQDVTAGIKQLPVPFTNATGTLRFNGQEVKVDNISARLGQIPLQANGSLNTQTGLNITAKVPNVAISNLTQTFKLKPPVALVGEVQAGVQLTGSLQNPLLLGQFATTKPTQVDKLQLSGISANFAFAPTTGEVAISNLVAKPAAGGQLTGKGQLKLGQQGGVVFEAQVQNVPGDVIARQYAANLPPTITIGNVSATAQVFGSLDNIRTIARWQAPQATYPAAGEIAIAKGETVLRNATFNVAGNTVQANGSIIGDRWSARIQGSQLPVGNLLAALPQEAGARNQGNNRAGENLPLAIRQGIVSLTANLSGSAKSFQLADIQANAAGNLQVAGGSVQLRNGNLNRGRWQADVSASGIALGSFPQVPPQLQKATFNNGRFTLAGNIASFQQPQASLLENITASGGGSVSVAGGNVQILQGQLNNGAWKATVRTNNIDLGQFAQLPPQVQSAFNGQFVVAGNLNNENNRNITAVGEGNIQVAGGRVAIRQLELDRGNWQVSVVAAGVQLGRLTPTPNQFQGAFSGQLQLAGNLDNLTANSDSLLSQIRARGSGNLAIASGNIQIQNAELNEGNLGVQVAVNNLQLNRLPQVPPQVPGAFSGQLRLAANLNELNNQSNQNILSRIRANATGNLAIAGGNVRIQNAQLEGGNWQAQIVAAGVQVGRLPQAPPQLQGSFNGQLALAGNLDSLTAESNRSPLSQINGSGSGELRIAAGNIQFRDLRLNQGNWQTEVVASNVQLGRLPQVPPQLQGVFNGQLQAAGNLDALSSPLSQIQVSNASGNLAIAGGNVLIRQAQLNAGNWQANVALDNVRLNRFSPQLRGLFDGNLQLAGNVASLTNRNRSPLADIRANGDVRFSQGVAAIEGPIAATIQWNGQQLQIQRATAPGLNVNGTIAANFNRNNQPNITGIDLNINAQNFNLQTLPIQLPNNITVAGRVDFNGRITGTPNAPNANGNLALRDFAIGSLKFDPVLSGDVRVAAGGGVNLNLAGTQDRIQLALDNNYNPVSFLVRQDGAEASGRKQGELLLVDVTNFPIATIKGLAQSVTTLPAEIASQPVSGQISGNFAININDRTIEANNVAIAQPTIGNYKADLISGNFRYANGIGEITNARLQIGESSYGLSGRLTQTDFVAKVEVDGGQIQNILTAYNIFNLQTDREQTASAAQVRTTPVGIPNASLQAQLRRFSEIEALLAQQRTTRQQNNRIPDISELVGNFSGVITISGALPSGSTTIPNNLQASFDLNGKDWQLGQYKADRVIARGTFKNGGLIINPIRIESQDTLLAFSGNVGVQQQSGRLELQNFPVEVLRNFVPLPVQITGKLNGIADISGTLENPEVLGNLTLAEGTLNGATIQSAQSIFRYQDARLSFDSDVMVRPPQPVLISGSVPYKLPFSSFQPASNNIELNVQVQNEGLALLNLLSRGQVEWRSGEGQAQLQVRGTFNQPEILGNLQVRNATIAAQVLPAPLTEVTANARFNGDRIFVENFGGNFSNGAVTATGNLPISQPDRNIDNTLAVTLRDLVVNLKGLYRGGVNGDLEIIGSVFNPNVGGRVLLNNGEVILGERPSIAATSPTQQNAVAAANSSVSSFQSPILEFNRLELVLEKNVQVTRPPLFTFGATGELTVSGPINNIRPENEATITLRGGQVNLFTTQFTLERGYEQTATFEPERGLDPVLDIRLVTTIPEVTGSRLPTSPISSEIADVPTSSFFGTLETVRIVANVEGPASLLGESFRTDAPASTKIVELTSTPSRSESEIVALIGGGFVQNLGRGDSNLGLANLAGSAFLSNQQVQGTITAIGEAIGLSELRLFPTAITSDRDDRARNSSTLGLAAEAVIDLNRQLSASVSKVITTQQPIQYNLRYRVNSDILLRGSTDLSGDTRALVEFEKRF